MSRTPVEGGGVVLQPLSELYLVADVVVVAKSLSRGEEEFYTPYGGVDRRDTDHFVEFEIVESLKGEMSGTLRLKGSFPFLPGRPALLLLRRARRGFFTVVVDQKFGSVLLPNLNGDLYLIHRGPEVVSLREDGVLVVLPPVVPPDIDPLRGISIPTSITWEGLIALTADSPTLEIPEAAHLEEVAARLRSLK